MKKRMKKIVSILLVLSFAFATFTTGGIANIINAAENFNCTLVKENGQWNVYEGSYPNYTFVGLIKNPYGWWFVKNGTIDFTFTGVAQNQYGWFYVKNGQHVTSFTGMAQNNYGDWVYVTNGKLDTKFTGLAKNQYGWWYMQNGKLNRDFIGLVKNQYGWWYIQNGTIDYLFEGLAKNQYGWWYVKNGTIDYKYNGYGQNQYGWFKVVNGKVTSNKPVTIKEVGSKEAGTLGFMWNEQDQVFYSAKDPWQRKWGYNEFYDWAAQLIVLYYDTARIKFNYNGYDWLVQLWKGQYGFVLLGAEVGIYYKDEGSLIEHYRCDDNNMRLKVGYICYDHNAELFHRTYQDTWWLTGFVPGKLDRFNDRSEMALYIRFTLKTREMRDEFVTGLDFAGFTPGRASKYDPDTYVVSGQTDVYLYWQYINEMK